MFWDNFNELCIKNNTKPNPVGKELGFSSGVITKWKNGSMPSTDALIKMSNHFGVSVDYLIGNDMPQAVKLPMKRTPYKFKVKNKSYKITQEGSKIYITPEQNKSSHSQSTKIDVDNPKVARAYDELSEDEKLEVQLYIMKKHNKKPL